MHVRGRVVFSCKGMIWKNSLLTKPETHCIIIQHSPHSLLHWRFVVEVGVAPHKKTYCYDSQRNAVFMRGNKTENFRWAYRGSSALLNCCEGRAEMLGYSRKWEVPGPWDIEHNVKVEMRRKKKGGFRMNLFTTYRLDQVNQGYKVYGVGFSLRW